MGTPPKCSPNFGKPLYVVEAIVETRDLHGLQREGQSPREVYIQAQMSYRLSSLRGLHKRVYRGSLWGLFRGIPGGQIIGRKSGGLSLPCSVVPLPNHVFWRFGFVCEPKCAQASEQECTRKA